MMNRRQFFASAAISALASRHLLGQLPAAESRPLRVLYGDGVHDDIDALQALCDGERVYYAPLKRSVQKDDAVEIRGATFRISKPITLKGESSPFHRIGGTPASACRIAGCHINAISSSAIVLPWRRR